MSSEDGVEQRKKIETDSETEKDSPGLRYLVAALRQYEVIEQRIEEFNKEEKTTDTVLEMLEMITRDGVDVEQTKEVMESILNSELVALLFNEEQVKA